MKGSHLKVVPDNYKSAPNATQLPTFIDIEDLTLEIEQKKIFEAITLPIYKNKINTLIGPSGCGKSSLLNCITRLSDYTNSNVTGTIRIDDIDIRHHAVDLIKLRKKIGMIFQKPIPFPMSIRKNFELPLKEHGIKNKAEIDHKMETALRAVGLWKEVANRIDVRADKLSGGQQQRLCIARVLVLEPQAILMDEPCSALDPLSSDIIEDLILELKSKYTIFLVTHNLAQAKRIADFVGFMWYHQTYGKLVEHNHADVIFNSPSNPITEAYVKGFTE